MRFLTKLQSLHSIQQHNSIPKLQHFHSKSSNLPKKHKTQSSHSTKTHKQTNDLTSIFTQITDIIGTDNLTPEHKNPSEFPISKQPQITNLNTTKQFPHITHGIPSVCTIAKKSTHLENIETEQTTQTVKDVSPIVHEVTKIVRADNANISMEKRLENAGFVFDEEIVDKVLKRCFKVGHLGLRFFNWLTNETGFRHTTKTYNTMIYVAGEAKEFDLMEELIQEMEKESCLKGIKTWTIVISSYGKAEMIGKALLVLEKMRRAGFEPDERVYKSIVCALCNAGKGEIAMEFYKEMVNEDIEVDMNLYKLLLNCLSRSGDIVGVRSVGDDMINVSQIPEEKVYSCMLRSFCISRRIREALQLLHELKDKNIMLDSENFEILVKGLCRNGEISDALEVVEIMKRNRIVDGKVYGIIINGYLRRDEVSKAFELFHSMKESGHVPTVSTYTELMQYLFRSNEYDRACKLYDEMLVNGVEPDIVAMTALVAGHIHQNRVSEIWKIFEFMKEKGIKVTHKSYLVFIKELCRVSKTDEALRFLNEMRDSKMNAGDEIFQYVIAALQKKGETENVDKIKQMWRDSRLYSPDNELDCLPIHHPSLCGGIKNVFDASEPAKPHEELISNHPQPGEDDANFVKPLQKVYTDDDLQEICNILSSSMDWTSMEEALEKCAVQFTPELILEVLRSCQQHGHATLKFFSWVGKKTNYKHTTETYNMAIKISGSAKDFEHMRYLYSEMKRRRCLITSDTWTIMIMQYGRTGLTEIALNKFEEMKKDNCEKNGNTYKYLIMCLCEKKGRKVDKAIKIFHEMINAGFVPDKELVEIYLRCLSEVGKLSDARRCIESLCKCGYAVPLSYSLVIRSLCRAGRLEQALSLVAEIGEERSTLDRYTYGSLVHGLLRAGRLEEALAKVDAMRQQGINPTVHVYTSLVVHYFKEKQIGKALEIFNKMGEEGCEANIVTFSALIRGYMNMGLVQDARNIFYRMKMKGPYPDFKTYSMFMNCLCETGRSEEALQLIDEMLGSGIVPSSVNFQTIFYGLNREGKQYLAQDVLKKKSALMSKRKFLT